MKTLKKAKTPMAPTRRRRHRPPEMTYEIHVEVDGRDLYDRDLYEYAPNMKYIVFDDMIPALTFVGETRRNVLRVRSRVLKRYPTAGVIIFEYPTSMADELECADAGEFKRSRDRLTLVARRARQRR